METIKGLILILMSSVLVNNIVFAKAMGVCPVFNSNKKNKNAVMGLIVTAIMVVVTAISWPLQTYVFDKFGLGYLETLVFTVLIGVIAVVLNKVIKNVPYVSLVALNSAVLAIAVNCTTSEYTFVQALVCALGTGLGFLVAMVVFGAIRSRLDDDQMPKCMRGLPITIISASIVSLALFAFAGIFENLLA